MDEYINRKLITDSLEEIYNDIPVWEDDDDWNKGIKEGIWVAMSCINALPSAQPERMRGKWIKMSDADGDYYVCNQCGEELPRYTTESPTWDIPYPPKYSIDKTNFCPNCGADMRNEQE